VLVAMKSTARLRRVPALRAMLAAGKSQRETAQELGVSQPAVSQQLKSAPKLDNDIHREAVLL